jgi:hypothetical protein
MYAWLGAPTFYLLNLDSIKACPNGGNRRLHYGGKCTMNHASSKQAPYCFAWIEAMYIVEKGC